MKYEIKEIERILATSGKYITYAERCYVLDYITNLQGRCEYLERSNNRREDEIMSLRDECVDGETYKSRNEKAIEYIKENSMYYDDNYGELCGDTNNLLNILQGDDESE